jgi:hypothetical protein
LSIAAVRLPCAANRRQVNSWFGATPCRRATNSPSFLPPANRLVEVARAGATMSPLCRIRIGLSRPGWAMRGIFRCPAAIRCWGRPPTVLAQIPLGCDPEAAYMSAVELLCSSELYSSLKSEAALHPEFCYQIRNTLNGLRVKSYQDPGGQEVFSSIMESRLVNMSSSQSDCTDKPNSCTVGSTASTR